MVVRIVWLLQRSIDSRNLEVELYNSGRKHEELEDKPSP